MQKLQKTLKRFHIWRYFSKLGEVNAARSVNAIGRRLVQVVNSTVCYMLLQWIDSLHCWANLSRQVTRFYKEIFCECDHSTDERSETRKHQSNTSFNILMNMLLIDFRVAKGCEISLLWRYLIDKQFITSFTCGTSDEANSATRLFQGAIISSLLFMYFFWNLIDSISMRSLSHPTISVQSAMKVKEKVWSSEITRHFVGNRL